MGKTKSGRVVIASAWLLAIAPAGHAESFDCVIKPSMLLKIGSPVSTTLQTVEVDRGQHIARDQIIARLESKVQAADVALDEARASNTADVMSHQARLAFAEAEDSRGERLLEGNNIPRQKVDELRTNLRVAQEDLRIAASNHQLQELETDRSRALLEQRTIRSPIDGIVVQHQGRDDRHGPPGRAAGADISGIGDHRRSRLRRGERHIRHPTFAGESEWRIVGRAALYGIVRW
jgi:multidrug efflux pump subunit AcrA (membrane-fusion protein)